MSTSHVVRSKKHKMKRGDKLFYIALMIWPIAHFLVFYIGVNFNSLLLTFQQIDVVENTTTYTLFGNLADAWNRLTHTQELVAAFGRSLLVYIISLLIGTPLALLFSFYIFKKMPMSKAFRVMLFAPSIISSIILVVIFKYFVESAIPAFVNKLTGDTSARGLLENENTTFATLMFYNIWISFGINCLMYVNAMNDISPEQIEAANLDGATGFGEFWHICLPSVYPTLATFLVVGIAGIFTNQFDLFSFYGDGAPGDMVTYGYWMYRETRRGLSNAAKMPLVASLGVWMTLIAAPLTLLARWLFNKFGPSTD